MKLLNNFQLAITFILIIAGASLVYKILPTSKHLDTFYAEEMYKVSYKFFFKSTSNKTKIKTYLPTSNARQRITREENKTDSSSIFFSRIPYKNSITGIWESKVKNNYESIDYSFTYEGKSKTFPIASNFISPSPKYKNYLAATKNIQVNNPKIDSIASKLNQEYTTDKNKIKAIFNLVKNIPSAPIITLTDAVTVIEQNRASCNGKSRLFVAIARNLGYPARIKGGIILESSNKRTSHAWAEVNINNKWIPFDALNNHFAYLPANYLELYNSDEFLITHTPNISFDYTYDIQKKSNIPFLNISTDEFKNISPISLAGLVDSKVISEEALILLLMLPIGGLLVGFLRNVVGLKTFGVFLPVLIAFSLLETGFLTGLLLFIFLILFVGIISKPFNNLGLLHTPKLVVSLTLMVIIMVFGSYIGIITGSVWLTSLTFFPTIILTISAEKFSTLVVEDGLPKATGTLFQTLIAVSFCYYILSASWLTSILILFPEFLLIVVALAMLLGKYIGLRWTEVLRFNPLLKLKTQL